MPSSIGELETKGFVSLSYPVDLRKAVERTVESWKAFCALSIPQKQGLPYSNGADGVGYELKDGGGVSRDHKENFDVTTGGKEWLEKNADKVQNEIALAFIQDATSLVSVMKPLVLAFAVEVEKEFSLRGFAREVEESADTFFVRFIHYFSGAKADTETASPHTDQSGFTLHLFESASGLQCLTYEKKWTHMPVSLGETVIIPAMQLQLRSKGALRALCHRVIATAETEAEGRYSAVCFVQLKHTPKYDKETHGRLQEKQAGFNYSLPLREFQKLFKK
ncbi:MAG: 2OG-Fe(II) oxygenase family protein [bacterium]|nr:2OG-Fe(II) oxygenase family protein [bacterium]